MQIIFLGTGAGSPSPQRNVAAIALRPTQRSDAWLFDCGEATQHQIMQSTITLAQVRRIFISHLHGDHVFGLPGFLATRGLSGVRSPIDIYGPKGTRAYLEGVLAATSTWTPFEMRMHDIEPGHVLDDGGIRVRCARLEHGIESLGYRVDEPDELGHFDAARAAQLGVPPGPLFGRLKSGEDVTLDDGTLVKPDGLVGPPLRGRSFTYCSDTSYCRSAVELALGCDVLVHEATFASFDVGVADLSGHSTAATAARVAAEAGAEQLVLTHISGRYSPGSPIEVGQLLNEAIAIFANTVAAEDFMTIDVARRGDLREPIR